MKEKIRKTVGIILAIIVMFTTCFGGASEVDAMTKLSKFKLKNVFEFDYPQNGKYLYYPQSMTYAKINGKEYLIVASVLSASGVNAEYDYKWVLSAYRKDTKHNKWTTKDAVHRFYTERCHANGMDYYNGKIYIAPCANRIGIVKVSANNGTINFGDCEWAETDCQIASVDVTKGKNGVVFYFRTWHSKIYQMNALPIAKRKYRFLNKSEMKVKKTNCNVYYNFKLKKNKKYKFTQDMTYVSGYGIIGLEYRDKMNYVVQNSKSKSAIIKLPKLLLNCELKGNEKKLKRECEGLTSYKDKVGMHLLINIKFTGKKGAVYETILK